MKILLACEGNSEVALLDSLIQKGQLSFAAPLFLDKPIRIRQLTNFVSVINTLPVAEDLIVFRVGDTLKDELILRGLEARKDHIFDYRICTRPEIEILLIINEGLLEDYQKSGQSPKSFLRPKDSKYASINTSKIAL